MQLIKNCVLIVFMSIVLFLGIDFILSFLGVDPNYVFRKNKISARVAHPVYHHDLKQNLDIIDIWGPIRYRLCTNEFGFKVSCTNIHDKRKDFDIAFIGDSFTESIGITYEESFVGLYAQNNPDIAVANFGVSSYSASIFLKKIEFLLNNGFTFKHLVVLPDISDIRDEALYYIVDKKSGAIIDNPEFIQNKYKDKSTLERILMQYFMFTWYIQCGLYEYFSDDDPEKKFKEEIEEPFAQWTRDSNMPNFGTAGVSGGIQNNLYYMRQLKQLLDKYAIKMTIAVYPWPTQLYFEDRSHLGMQLWKDFCIKEDCHNFIDANPFFFDEVQKTSKKAVIAKYYIHGDCHFNAEGNRAIAEIINSQMRP